MVTTSESLVVVPLKNIITAITIATSGELHQEVEPVMAGGDHFINPHSTPKAVVSKVSPQGQISSMLWLFPWFNRPE